MSRYRFTSESVTEGHPDKLCDQVSDAILDAILEQDSRARVACESLAKTGMVVVAGEITTTAKIDFPQVVRQTVKDIGYTDSAMGFDGATCAVLVAVERQSPDIAQGVNEGDGLHKEQGAGDQGLMFGYATDETPELMPAPIHYAHALARQLAAVRKKKAVDFLRPDGKTQVTLEYDNDVPVRIDAIVVSTQHDEKVKYKQLREAIVELVIDKALPKKLIDTGDQDPRQPHGSLRRRRAAGRLRAHRAQDHRRLVRWHGPSRRRRVQRQGPEQGRSQRLLLRAASSRRTWWRRAWPSDAKCRSRTRSASRSPSACT